jgi:hypothetical protein
MRDQRNDTRFFAERRAAAVREVRAAATEAGQRIDQLMIVRRRQLAAARLRRGAR